MTVLSAPAGYGKTTVLAQALAANAGEPAGVDCWLGCEPDDESASSLAMGLHDALGSAFGPLDPSGPAVSAGPGDPSGPGRPNLRTDAAGDPVEAAAGIVEELWRRSPTQVALVLDDVHHVRAGSPAADLLAAIVEHLPGNGHLVLAGRTPPPLPLARLELEGRLVRLDEGDLAFTADEIAAFAATREVPEDRLAGCGGWPALAELTASARAGTTAAYVGEEVLAGLTPERRRALTLLAHLDGFDRAVADAALGEPVDLDDLLCGLPLVARSPTGERSLHSLWRSLLDGQVAPGEIAAARRRAAAALRDGGRPAAAARLLVEARAWDDLGETVVDVLGAAHPPVPRDVLTRWYRHMPEPARAAPGGRLLAGALAADADPVRAAADLDAAAAAFQAAGHHAGELACLVQLAQVAWWTEDASRLAAIAARVFALDAAGFAPAEPLARLGRALVADVRNDAPTVLAELDRITPGTLNDTWAGVVSWLRSTSSMHLGQATAALEAADEALTHGGPLHRPLAEGARLQARWFLGQVAEVAGALPDLVERTRATGRRSYTALAASRCAHALAMLGRPEPAAGHLARARAAAGPAPTPLLDSHLSLAAAALAVARGDEDGATSTIDACLRRQPLTTGHSAAPQQRSLALLYVLAPETRPVWDGSDLGPAFTVARDLARALVGVRTEGRLPRHAPPLPDPGVVLAHLPHRWAAALAVAAVAAGRDDGRRLLDALWPDARPAVVELGERGPRPLRRAARTAVSRLAVPPPGRLHLRLLGPVTLHRDGAPVDAPDWRRERVRSLLAHLALHRHASRDQIGDDLWPALDAEAQSRNLRVTLTYLLRVLEPDRAPRGASFHLRSDGAHIELHPGGRLDVDVWAFDTRADQAREADRRGSPSAALDHALAAVELWRGDPTELAGESWAVPLVERRRLRLAELATRAGELLLATGALDGARALAERALAVDEWREDAHRLVVAAHRAAGDGRGARLALDRFRDAMHDLGVEPDEATRMVERLVEDAATATSLAGR